METISFYIKLSFLQLIEKEEDIRFDWKARKETVELLLEKGCDVKGTDKEKNTALTLLLSAMSAFKRKKSLTAESVESDPHIWSLLKMIVSRTTDSLNMVNTDEKIALSLACEAHMPKTVKLLIESGGDIHYRCRSENRNLIHACCSLPGTIMVLCI